MLTLQPKISVCIPAYNRADVLPELLNTIFLQDFDGFEIVICEDKSPQRAQIAEVVNQYNIIRPGLIQYFENSENLGYDGNLRNLIEKSQGEYCLFMGNDDLMCEGTLTKVAATISRHPNIGVLLRSYATFDGTPDNIVQTFRYFDQELFFPAGAETISTIYRRSVVIPGMVIHRESAANIASNQFDGTLLYQLYLVANILVSKNAVYLPDVIVLYRNGGVPDFGNNENERGKFVPKEQTPESSLHFMQGMLAIAKSAENKNKIKIYDAILSDIGNYSYPIISIQASKPLNIFLRYCWGLAKLGFWKNKMFYLYFLSILILGVKNVDKMIGFIKNKLGHTPVIGKVYKGN